MKNEHNIDQLFKAGLGDPEIPFNEKDWENMVKKLDAPEKKRVLPIFWFAGASVAAAVLLFLFSGLFKQEPVRKDKDVVKSNIENSYTKTKEQPQKTPEQNKPQHKPLLANTIEPIETNFKHNLVKQASQTTTTIVKNLPSEFFSTHLTLSEFQKDSARFIPMKIHEEIFKVKRIEYATIKRRAPFTFSIMAAPDISSTGSNLSSKVSSNFGLLVSYPLTKKISISSGLIYAKKVYNSAGVAAIGNGYMDNSWEVNADCKVLDIPLNVNYQVFKKQRYSISVNTGLSSYLMLNERYELQSGPEHTLSNVEFRNRNQHIFGVANLSVGIERKINSSLSIGLQPFVKLPLTGIGNYDVRLNSTGVLLSLNFGR